MNNKENLFVNKINKSINNNDRVYYSNNDRPKNIKEKNNSIGITEKINSIFKSSNYIYKANVKIRFKNKTEVKVIVGKNKNNLITMDNELINIADIVDIEVI